MVHLENRSLLSDRQPAFSKKKKKKKKKNSCETQLVTVINDWAKILKKGAQVDAFILDFEKAFDTLPMNFSNANCLDMALGTKHVYGEICSCVLGSRG